MRMKSNRPYRAEYAENLGLYRRFRRRLRVSSAWGNSRSHSLAGKVGSAMHNVVMKWALKVWIARSAAFRRCTCGGTSW